MIWNKYSIIKIFKIYFNFNISSGKLINLTFIYSKQKRFSSKMLILREHKHLIVFEFRD